MSEFSRLMKFRTSSVISALMRLKGQAEVEAHVELVLPRSTAGVSRDDLAHVLGQASDRLHEVQQVLKHPAGERHRMPGCIPVRPSPLMSLKNISDETAGHRGDAPTPPGSGAREVDAVAGILVRLSGTSTLPQFDAAWLDVPSMIDAVEPVIPERAPHLEHRANESPSEITSEKVVVQPVEDFAGRPGSALWRRQGIPTGPARTARGSGSVRDVLNVVREHHLGRAHQAPGQLRWPPPPV